MEEARKKFLKADAGTMVGGLLRLDREAMTVDELDNEVDEPEWWEDPELEFVEDGQALDEVYEEAMWKEIEMLQAFNVFHVGDRKQLKEQDYNYLSTAWVEAWGPDGLKMSYVAREFKWLRKRFDLFTAASTSTTERMVDCIAVKKGQKRMILDAKNAYCHVPEEEKLFIDPPKVWMDWWWAQCDDGRADDDSMIEDPVWIMDKTLYGRRIASSGSTSLLRGS